MRTQKQTFSALLMSILALFAVGHAAADPLLDMLPAETLVCVRINNLDMALTQLDAYLTGTSPFPIGMMAKGQLSQIVGDPEMTGINTGGNFCFIMFAGADTADLVGGLLVPMTSFSDFVAKNPNCKKDETGAILLTSPGLPMGSLELTELAEGKYALVTPKEMVSAELVKTKITSVKTALKSRLSAEQAKQGTTAPVWAYVNTDALYKQYSQDILQGLDSAGQGMTMAMQADQTMAKQMGPMAEFFQVYFNMYAEMFKTFAGDADSITLALTPDASNLTLDIGLKAKDGSQTAKMLATDTQPGDYKFTGYMDSRNAINGIMKMDPASLQQMYDTMFDILDKAANGKIKPETLTKSKAMTRKSLAAMGDELAFSFSYAGGKPPFNVVEVVAVKDPKVMQDAMKDSMDLVGDLYSQMGLPMTFNYQPNTGTYKNAAIDTMVLTVANLDDPNNPAAQAMEQMYGGHLTYQIAHTADQYFIAMGPDSEATLKKAIDQNASAPATGEVKAAIDLMNKAGYGDFACSINIIKLFTGLGEMMQSMEAIAGAGENPIPADILAIAKNVPSQSSLAMGGKTVNGQVSLRTVLPKQHLMEIMSVVMQAQQKMMMQQMQSSNGQ